MKRPDGKAKRAAYDAEFKLRVVRAAIEKKLTPEEVHKTFAVPPTTYLSWIQKVQAEGEEALRKRRSRSSTGNASTSSPANVELRQHVAEVKRKHPYFGIARVWQWLRRTLFLPVSYRAVRRTMKEENLLVAVRKRKRRPAAPKSYERAKPNQMWCSDITEFTIGRGLMVHVIGFMDDHSRYIVAWGIYAAATSELVLEVLRNGHDTYGYPVEILTDNGPQYKTWRGVTKFQKHLQREDIRHVLCGRQNPQGNGKIEAFWGTLKKEFVALAPLGSLEDVRERLTHWMNFYNWQRPHESLDWATPAERFFQFAAEAKAEIQKRIRDNEKELAFTSSRPGLGRAQAGGKHVEVSREEDSFVVRLGGAEIKRTTLDPKKENPHEKESGPAGENRGDGSRREGEGDGRPDGAGGGESHQRGLPGDGTAADPVLQAGSADGRSDAGGGEDAPDAGAAAKRVGGGHEPLAEDGGPAAGAPSPVESGSDLQEADATGIAAGRSPRPGAASEEGVADDASGGSRGAKAGPNDAPDGTVADVGNN